LTTQAGSLPREEDLGAMIRSKAQGEVLDEGAFFARMKTAVGDVVRLQAEAGIDVVSDGEQARVGLIPYVNERLAGITPSPTTEAANYWSQSREYRERSPRRSVVYTRPSLEPGPRFFLKHTTRAASGQTARHRPWRSRRYRPRTPIFQSRAGH
jgi:5-methyltetrahydropteroyltriglutamate--homocysteine methyltransferase